MDRSMTRDQTGVIDSLLPVNQREVGIRAEAEKGSGIIGVIVFQISHAGLFIAAEERAYRIAERDPGILQILQRVKAEHAGTLVVHHASADQKALTLAHGEGILAPAVPGGDDVDMGDGGEIALTAILADRGIADPVFAVDGVQAELRCNLQGAVERPPGLDTERRVRFGRAFDAGNADEAGDIADDVALVGLCEAIDVRKSVFVNGNGVHGEPPCVSKNRIQSGITL